MKVEGGALDFSFLELTSVIDLRKKEPRAGKRKPIEETENDEDDKKNESLLN